MVRQILPNNNEKCYRNFFPKIFTSKHALRPCLDPQFGECQITVWYCSYFVFIW
jgi:hypothetical protein